MSMSEIRDGLNVSRIKSDKNETPTMILDLIHKPSLVNIFDHKNMIIIRHKGCYLGCISKAATCRVKINNSYTCCVSITYKPMAVTEVSPALFLILLLLLRTNAYFFSHSSYNGTMSQTIGMTESRIYIF